MSRTGKASAWALASWLLLAAHAWTSPARAQDAAASGALFDRGLADMQAGKYDTGCPALGESYRLDPRPGTLFTWAECQAKWGKIASAVTHYEDYLERVQRMTVDQQVHQREREQVATAQLAALKPQVPQLTLRLANLPAGMKVMRDGSELGAASLNVPLPLDPGDHTITITGAGGERSEQRIHIDRGESKTLDVVVPAIEPAAPLTAPVTPPEQQPSPLAEPRAPAPASHRGWTIVTGSVAFVAFATSMTLGSVALAKKSDIDANCVDTSCNATGKQAADAAQAFALASTVTFVASAVLGVVTIVLAVTEPSAAKRSVSVTSLAREVLGLRATF